MKDIIKPRNFREVDSGAVHLHFDLFTKKSLAFLIHHIIHEDMNIKYMSTILILSIPNFFNVKFKLY